MAYEFCVNSNITFGKGALKRLPDMLRQVGASKVMIVYDAGVKAAGIAEKVVRLIEESGIPYVIFDGVIPNPTNEVVGEASEIAKKEEVDAFIAAGGGSSIDLAKAINVLMKNPGPIERYGGINQVKNPGFPLIAIPTTAGTSSEITNVSALIDTKKVIKYVIIDNKIMPSMVLADPELTLTVPPSVTAATGMDAITHAVESYISNMATPLTEYNALKGLEILYGNLETAVKDGKNENAREQMMLGCIITGFSFSNANLGLTHAIAHTLSARFKLAHGMANAAVLPYVMEFNASSCPEKMVDLARAIGLKLSGEIEEDSLLLSRELLQLTKKLEIKKLSEQGIRKEDLDALADDSLKEPVLGFNPRSGVQKDDIMKILYKAF